MNAKANMKSTAARCSTCGSTGQSEIGRDGSPRRMEALGPHSDLPLHVERRARAARLRRVNGASR